MISNSRVAAEGGGIAPCKDSAKAVAAVPILGMSNIVKEVREVVSAAAKALPRPQAHAAPRDYLIRRRSRGRELRLILEEGDHFGIGGCLLILPLGPSGLQAAAEPRHRVLRRY